MDWEGIPPPSTASNPDTPVPRREMMDSAAVRVTSAPPRSALSPSSAVPAGVRASESRQDQSIPPAADAARLGKSTGARPDGRTGPQATKAAKHTGIAYLRARRRVSGASEAPDGQMQRCARLGE